MDKDCVGRITTSSPDTDVCAFIGGFVAGEGCFTTSAGRWRFAVALGAADTDTLVLIQGVLGVGSINRYDRRQPHYDDEVVYSVMSRRDLIAVVVPFMDRWLPASYKREQFEAWRATLLAGTKEH